MGQTRFVVNSEGETVRQTPGNSFGNCIVGSVNTVELAARLGHDPSNKEIDAEFFRQSQERHTPAEHALYQEWNRIANAFSGGGIFRHYAELLPNGQKHVWLNIEFCNFIEGVGDFWQRMEQFAAKVRARVDVMDERDNDGRMERQVSVDGDVLGETGRAIRSLMARMVKEARALRIWPDAVTVV